MSLVQDSEDAEDVNQTIPTIWNYFKVVRVQSKRGGEPGPWLQPGLDVGSSGDAVEPILLTQ